MIECFTDAPGINLLVAGDSQLDGTGSTANINSYFNMATSTLTREGCPVSSVNLAWGGSRLNQWFAQLVAALDFVQPSALLMQGISWNDDQQTYDTMMDSFVWQQARIRAIRAKLDERIPIILVPSMPREPAYNPASNSAELISAWVDVLRLWNKTGGVVLKGLQRRRAADPHRHQDRGLLAPVSRLVGALNIEMFGNAMPHRAVHRAG